MTELTDEEFLNALPTDGNFWSTEEKRRCKEIAKGTFEGLPTKEQWAEALKILKRAADYRNGDVILMDAIDLVKQFEVPHAR